MDKLFKDEDVSECDLFLAEYHLTRADQDYDNQSVLSDLNEERYYGNTEYKLRLNHCSSERIVRLTTQMKFRIQEGTGEAFYVIGAGDKGEATGITTKEMEDSLRNLHKMASTLKANLTVVNVYKGRIGEIVRIRVV
jgi:GTPase